MRILFTGNNIHLTTLSSICSAGITECRFCKSGHPLLLTQLPDRPFRPVKKVLPKSCITNRETAMGVHCKVDIILPFFSILVTFWNYRIHRIWCVGRHLWQHPTAACLLPCISGKCDNGRMQVLWFHSKFFNAVSQLVNRHIKSLSSLHHISSGPF